MKNQYLLFTRTGISFLALLFFLFVSPMIFGQITDIPPSGSLTDDVKPNYNGWLGHPAKIQVYGAPPVNQAALQEACKRWNDAGGNPQLEVTNKPEEAEVTVKINTSLTPGTGKCSYDYYPSGYSSATININPGTPPQCGETELITHELGHALGLADTESGKNPGDAMKGKGSNGTGGKLNKHDSAEIKAASVLNITHTPADAPPVAISPGTYAIAQFPLSQTYPPEVAALAIISVSPVRDPDIVILGTNVDGDHLSVNLQVLPDHWSGQFYLDIHIEFPPPYEAVNFMGWHYVNSTPVPPTIFDCPFVVSTLPDHSIMIEWESTCTYPIVGAELRSTLTINDYVSTNTKGGGSFILSLPSGVYTIRLDVDDFQGNFATSTQIITVSTPGTYFIPSVAYPTIASAIAFLNTSGVPAGGATFNVDANYVETGINLTLNTPTGSLANPIVFQKNPFQSGANPKLIVSAGSTSTTDGGIIIAGTDYVTFDQIDIDASAQTTIEWGYALVKRQNLAPFDGCQHISINNCNITLNKINTKATGIYSGNHVATATTSLPITATTDACNDCQFDNNTISNVYIGISLNGYGAPLPYILYDHNNEIGQYGMNRIYNFGGSSVASYGIYATNQDLIKVMNDSIAGNPGSTNRVAGILLQAGVSSSAEIANNYISVTGSNTASQSTYGIWNLLGGTPASNTVSIHHNIIKDCSSTVTTASGPLYGILNSAAADTIKIYNNSIYGSILSTSGAQSVIRSEASANNVYIYKNQIYNITNSGTGGLTLIHSQGPVNSYIHTNILSNCNANGGTVYGIYSALGTNANIYGNNLFNINSNNGATASSLVYGINNSSTPNINIYNNFISDLKANMATNNPAVCGLYLTGGITTNVIYNTVYLDQAVAGSSSFGSCALYSGTTPTTTLINNILVNVSAHGATGYTVAHRRSTNNLATYSSNSNNNNFFAGTPSIDLIYYDGTTPYPSLPGYQVLVAPRDAASFTEIPPFKNTFLSPYNLHLKTGVTTLCESGGTLATAPLVIPEDIDGEPRFPNPGYPKNPSQPATAPDVGADEFAGGPVKTLTISAFLEGLYNGLASMYHARNASGPQWPDGVADHITVELHNSGDYDIIELSVPDVELSTAGIASFPILNTQNGMYFVTIKHRNSIETTSAIPQDFSLSDAIEYEFDSETKAFGNNLKVMPDGQVVIWTGDPNQDGLVDGSDMNDIGNMNDLFATGYLDEDINGDGLVDGTDLNMTGNNNDLFARSMTP